MHMHVTDCTTLRFRSKIAVLHSCPQHIPDHTVGIPARLGFGTQYSEMGIAVVSIAHMARPSVLRCVRESPPKFEVR
jgi:hypothetical protein